MNDQVVLVDTQDNPIGIGDKLLTHIQGRLHRALSVVIFNSNGEILLQQRAFTKYHSAGLWTNTCCSHPMPNELTLVAAQRRLMEEMGISCDLVLADKFIYKTDLDDDLTEHELDYVFFGHTDSKPKPNPDEVCNWRYISPKKLAMELKQHPKTFTSWFHIMCEKEIVKLS
jgi:isopentenyl-diphosphate delta-isomerase